MYNINTPIVSMNNYQGGVQTPPSFSFQNNGNVIGIGNAGYNGGYYNGAYTIYNPYLLQEQQRQEEIRRKEQLRQRSDAMKMLSKKVNKSLGYEISEEQLDNLYDPVELRQSERDIEIQNTYRLMAIDQYNMSINYSYSNPLYYAMGRVQEENQKKLDPKMDLAQFLEVSGELISDSIKQEVLRKRKEVNNLYNRSDYQKLIDLRSGNNFPGTFKPNANIDDMEIQLPEHLKNNYQKRKEQFLEALINRGGANRG